jgi:crossover junction endodeoxyribonuclease RusA
VGKGRLYRSNEYSSWRATAAWEARLQAGPRTISGKFGITANFVRPDNRPRDLDNLLKAVLDCLQHAGVIKNDKHCQYIEVKWVEEGPPCEVILEVM